MRWLAPLLVPGLLLALAAPAHAAPKAAVVDLVQLMEKHPESAQLDKRFKDARDLAQEKLKSQERRLEELREEIQLMHGDDSRRRAKQHEYESLRLQAKLNYETDLQHAVQDYVRGMENIYAAVLAEVKRYADGNGIDLVLLRTDPGQPLNAADPSDFGLKARLRIVLYAAPALDITAEVLKQPVFAGAPR